MDGAIAYSSAMQGTLPAKASAFMIISRPDRKVYCTLEGPAKQIGVPGGKWDPETDPANWDAILAREFGEEVGAALPESEHHGYLEWGSPSYQIRFKIMRIDWDTANALPAGDTFNVTDPDRSVLGACWMSLKAILKTKGRVRPHILAAFEILASSQAVRQEVYRGVVKSAAKNRTITTRSAEGPPEDDDSEPPETACESKA